jgi:hypothetical protein
MGVEGTYPTYFKEKKKWDYEISWGVLPRPGAGHCRSGWVCIVDCFWAQIERGDLDRRALTVSEGMEGEGRGVM